MVFLDMDKQSHIFYNPSSFRLSARAQIAQLVEQGIENPCVAGSIPALGTIFKTILNTQKWALIFNKIHQAELHYEN